MSALGKVVRAGVGRRRVQTLVMILTTMMAVTASTLAAGLLVASKAPFEHAFAEQHGAHLTVRFDGTKVTAAQAAATAHVHGVRAAAGPNLVLSLRPHVGANSSGAPVGDRLPPMMVVARSGAGGPVDDLDLTAGRWVNGPGEIVVTSENAPLGVGDKMMFPELPGDPALTVVGQARSVGASAEAWVSPAQVAALTPRGVVPGRQMLYRFADAATNAQVATGRAAIAGTVPPGSMTEAASYLKIKLAAERASAVYVPFVVAFGLLGLFMSVLIIGIVVSGAVGAATRRIGILKAVGFTPAQVVRAYVAQALLPAAIGTGLGVVFGDLAAIPAMGDAAKGLNTGPLAIAPWIDAVVPAGALAAVTVTALAAALRAGRLRTVEAIAVGRTPHAGRGRMVRHLLGRLPLPRAVSLGLASPFVRPARSGTMAAAVAFGTIGVTFGVGLAVSLNGIQHDRDRRAPGAVVVQNAGPPAPLPGAAPDQRFEPAAPEKIAAKLDAQRGTRRYFSFGQTRVGVAGLAGQTTVIAYRGDSSWGSYRMLAGSWFGGPGQAVVPSGFLTATRTHVGDTITLTGDKGSAPVRIVGEAFDLSEEGMVILTDSASLAGTGAYVLPESVQFAIDLKPGTDRNDYVDSLDETLRPLGVMARSNGGRMNGGIAAMDTLVAMLTAMLVAVAVLGVLNTVVLDTRERVHELGVFKALGMSPRQLVSMVITSVAGVGLVAGVLGVPIGIALHGQVMPAMGRAAGTRLPAADLAVYHPPVLVPLVLGGLVIAVAGALLPAGWAARTRTATALRTE